MCCCRMDEGTASVIEIVAKLSFRNFRQEASRIRHHEFPYHRFELQLAMQPLIYLATAPSHRPFIFSKRISQFY